MNDTQSTSDRVELRYVFSFFVGIAMVLAIRRQARPLILDGSQEPKPSRYDRLERAHGGISI
jgi:hypothetical protein